MIKTTLIIFSSVLNLQLYVVNICLLRPIQCLLIILQQVYVI